MLRSNLPRAVRALRRRRGWRQTDLADAAGVSRQMVSRIERNELRNVAVGAVARVAAALGASGELTVRWRGEELDRLFDSAHASIVQACVAALHSRGWEARVEVSFSHFGERGRVDVLAWHAPTRTVLVIEVKSAIGNEQELVGRLDAKARLGPVIAHGVGWDAAAVVPALVIGDARTARRIVAAHQAAFARFTVRGRRALAWVRRPAGATPSGLLWFVSLPNARGMSVTRNARIRTVKSGQ